MKHLYDIYTLCKERDCVDLTIAIAMYRAEHPDVIDSVEDREMREFIGRHGKELSAAFKAQDRAAFDAVVAACMDRDAAV